MHLRHLALVSLVLGACSSGSGSAPAVVPGSEVLFALSASGGPQPPSGPAWDTSGRPLFADEDAHQGGTASEILLAELRFGQLVDVYEEVRARGARRLVVRDYFVGLDVGDRAGTWTLDEHPTTGKSRLTIPHAFGSPAFKAAIQALEETPTAPTADDPSTFGPNPVFVRDAALALRFDDLLDPATLYEGGVQLTVGTGVQLPFDARIIADAWHGGFADRDGDGRVEYYPTRIVVGATSGIVDVVRDTIVGQVNTLGLPPALDPQEPNVTLRLPTQADPGAPGVVPLRNLAGATLAATGQGPVDASSPTVDLLRLFRSGMAGLDPNDGLLPDEDPPRLLGTSVVELRLRAPFSGGIGAAFEVDLRFTDERTAHAIHAGEVLSQPRVHFEVLRGAPRPDGSGVVRGVLVGPLAGDPRELTSGPAVLSDAYDPKDDATRAGRFIGITPGTADGEAAILPESSFAARFSEPVDAATLDPFETFRVTRRREPRAPGDFVVGSAQAFGSNELLSFVPALPLDHVQDEGATYFVNLGAALADRLGNAFGADFVLQVKTDRSAPTRATGGLALRFETADEDGDGAPEVRGQHLPLGSGRLEPRPVARFSATADDTVPVRQLMTPFPGGVQAPANPLGSRLQALWRHVDLDLGLFDESGHDVDVEGLWFSPPNGVVGVDGFAEFEIALGHAAAFPDEALDPGTLFPFFPASGLATTFASNAQGDLSVVHPRERGYSISPGDLESSASGLPLIPLPLNRGIPVAEFRTFTWRDTALRQRGAPGGGGLEPRILAQADPGVVPGAAYAPGEVPTIGLPLLMDLRCFPDPSAFGTNGFNVSLAVLSTFEPRFRVHSSGGVNGAGQIVVVDPDQAVTASGGFNPTTGMQTAPGEATSYLGQVDLVTRVSRVHSRWFDTQAASPSFANPVAVAALPPGTSIELAFRGATNVLAIAMDANELDFYGDAPLGTVAFGALGEGWTDELSDLDGQRFVQVRVSFAGDLETLATSALAGLGLAWTE